jgi:hypothetical protein
MQPSSLSSDLGGDFWRNAVKRLGLEEATSTCSQHIASQLKSESVSDRKFCRELFVAMMKDLAGRTDPNKLLYPYTFEKAAERTEESYFRENAQRNADCARGIDHYISESYYKTNHYNLELAAMLAVQDYGFHRVGAVLAHHLQEHAWDGRYSRDNKDWAGASFVLPEKAFTDAYLSAHPTLIEAFARHTRKLYDAVDMDRFALPGHEDGSETVHGYKIIQSISFDDNRGFVIGMNPEAVSPYVSWQFTMEDGQRDYYWGRYGNTITDAAESYIARIIVHMKDEDIREVQSPLAAAEMANEQKADRVDGTMPVVAGVAAAQSHKEIMAPAHDGKPSVLEQIQKARKAPQAQPKKEHPQNRDKATR